MKRKKSKKLNKKYLILIVIILICIISLSFYIIFAKRTTKIVDTAAVPEVVIWNGSDPYPSIDWSEAKPGLQHAVQQFQTIWGSKLHVLQVYRPEGYTRHLRSVWEVWRYTHGKSYTAGYGCENYTHINPANIKNISLTQRAQLESEARRHGFTNGGDTPPACASDHSLGFAVDINPPSLEPAIYKKWIDAANQAGLCHYIKGDEPHFGLASYLPPNTNCTVE